MGLRDLDRAALWAAELHAGQMRDGDVPLPYIAHPLEVLYNLRYLAEVTDEQLLCVALLHDVVEECDVRPDEIERRFGGRVAGLVRELTRDEPTEDETAGMSASERWQYRSDRLIAEIAAMSEDAKRVKLADRASNLQEALFVRKGEKLDRYARQSRQILDLIDRRLAPALWDRVADLIARTERAGV